jgi:MoxR-like ATPase
MTTVIIHGPAGSGKTEHRRVLAARLGCHRIVDNWTPLRGVTPGALHLTNLSPHCLPPRLLSKCDSVLHIDLALRLINALREEAPDLPSERCAPPSMQ